MRSPVVLEALKARAQMLASIRQFFSGRDVLEVETPLLCSSTTSEFHIESFRTLDNSSGVGGFLQTSPEACMKRLLAAGSGPIYQICKAFRAGEAGRLHNAEFSMLEWYRPGMGYQGLMDEVSDLLHLILRIKIQRRISYGNAFSRYARINPFHDSLASLRRKAGECGLASVKAADREQCLDFLLSQKVQPGLGAGLTFIYDFPASQAAMARIRNGLPPVAERFEAYVDGVELANGYRELTDPLEQESRMRADLVRREAAGMAPLPVDEKLLAALGAGLPECSGVALGLDRLMMLATGSESLAAVIAFPYQQA